MPESETPIAGGCVFAFRWMAGQLTQVDWDKAADANIEVKVDVFLSQQRLLCGHISVSTVPTSDFQRLNTLGSPSDPAHIDSALWRALPIGRLVDEAFARVRGHATKAYEKVGDEYLGAVGAAGRVAGKRGPRPTLTEELLAKVVAPAFKTGGRRPVEAVQAAMQAAGYPGSGPRGDVTIDQARKAIKKARDLELLARPQRKPRRQGE